ncbi:MAG TPA: ATP-binding cassette domain-containing protein [Longimicrobium sp.]|nr:ATP-binding cassette domain-containing protein [Longimicrobium sp.]
MATARIIQLSRWRAFLGLLWSAARWRAARFGAVVLLVGLLPTAVILVTGALVRAIPAAVAHGLDAPDGRPAVLALSGLVFVLAVLTVASNALWRMCRVLDAAYALEVHQTVARVTLGTPGVAPLEDPVLADQLQAVQEAEKRGLLRRTASELSYVATMRIRGAGAFVVLLAFAWWAPLLLLAAWHLTNRVYLKATESEVSFDMGPGAAGHRKTEYLRALALEPAAAKELRVFGLDGWMVGRYADAWLDTFRAMWRSRKANRGLTAAATLALVAAHAAVLGALVLAAGRGDLGVATLLVFVQAAIASADLGLVGDSQWSLAQSLAVAERIELLRSRAGAHLLPAGPAAPAAAARGKVAVRLEGVRFTYRGRGRATLDGLDLEIPAGQSLAIVGENGAGKSTLVKLLCGLYEPDAGRITLDGGASPLQARGRLAVIFQDFVRYKLPLRDNVGFGHLPLLGDAPALDGALRDAGGAALLAALPAGWETVLSREFQGGADLSGGQWQRVALARALAAVRGGAGLLILDEPTAALDVRAEVELFERFLELTRNVTTILVSHRLSSVRRADRIVVLGGGRVVEDGTHDELVRAGGRYATMFALQAERFAAAPPADAATREEAGHA